jgi:hypothetical protein
LIDSPTDTWTARATAVTKAALRRPALTTALLDYYAPDRDACGISFLDGTESIAPHVVVAGDLFAVTTLGLAVPPPLARRLLHDTAYAAAVSGCLSPSRLPLTATLAEAEPRTVAAMTALHNAVLSACRLLPDVDAHTVASALCARKRPELFPVLDGALRGALGLPDGATPAQCWLVLRDLLRDPGVAEPLERAFASAREVRPDALVDVYPLRQLYVLLVDLR